jgi:type I restriction enzyme, S subunit
MAEVNLPEDWVNTHLDSLTTDISYGYTASSTENKVGPRMLRITDIQDNHVEWKNVPFCEIDDSKIEKYLLQRNDLVFARTGATVGKSYLIRSEPPQAVYASYLIRVRTASDDLISMLAHFFNSSQYWQQITEFSSGIGQPNVNGTKLKNLIVPLPPLAEQKVIAEKLDTLLAQVDNTKARLERIPEILKRFRQSVLAAAVSGKLTEVSTVKLGELNQCASIVSGLAFKKSQYSESGSRLLQIANVGYGKTKWDSCNFIPLELAQECNEYSMADGDIVLALNRPITNDTLKVAWVEFSDLPATLYQRVARIRCKGKVLKSEYLFLLMQSPKFLKLVELNLKGSDQPYLNTSDLASFEIHAPDEVQQTEIVRRVEELFAFADRIEQAAQAALSRVNNLTQSILAKAFRGELTADWRAAHPELISGENSAEALLARIKAERAKVSKKPKCKA